MEENKEKNNTRLFSCRMIWVHPPPTPPAREVILYSWRGRGGGGHKDTTAKSYDPLLIYFLLEEKLFVKLYQNMYIYVIVFKQDVDIVTHS